MSEGDERFHRKRFKGKRLEIPVKSAGKGSRPPRSESDGDRTPTINICDGLKATNQTTGQISADLAGSLIGSL